MTNKNILRRRFVDLANRDRYVNKLLEELSRLWNKTDPRLGPESAKDKDRNAHTALMLAGQLVDAVAGWAIDHKRGLASQELSVGQPLLSLPENNQRHPNKLSGVDDHSHEANGSDREREHDVSATRLLLINLLSANSGGFPGSSATDLRDALRDLEFGRVSPLLEPAKTYRKVSLEEQNLQLNAIGSIAFRYAQGWRKERAFEEVAEAYGVSRATISSWEQRLRSEYGAARVEQEERFAKHAAAMLAHERSLVKQGDTLADPEPWESMYGRQALEAAGKRYEKLKRERKKRNRTQRPGRKT